MQTLTLKRDLLLVSGGRLVAALLALISIRAVTTYLSPAQYGELALLIAVQLFCGLFLINPIGQHINLHTHAWWDDGTLLARLKSYRGYVLAVSLVGGAVALCIVTQHTTEQLMWGAIVVFFMVAAGTWNATLIPILNMLGFRAESALWAVITLVAGLALSILLVTWKKSAIAWLGGQALGMLLGAMGARYVLQRHALHFKHGQAALPLLNRQSFLAYCLPLSLATGLMWLQLSGYRFLIERYWGLAQLGFMVVGLQLAGQIFALAESLAMQFLYPMFFRQASAHEKTEVVAAAFSDLLNILAPLYLVLAGLVFLSAPYALKVLVAPQFHDAMIFVQLGAGIELCRVLGNLLSNAAHVRRKTQSLALPYALGAIVALTLVYVSSRWQLHIVWAGVSLLAGATSMLVIMWINMGRQISVMPDVPRWLAGAGAMLAIAVQAVWVPKQASLTGAIMMLMLMAAGAGVAGMALLWKNPAAIRLLNVKLGKS